ncbi:alpha-galactosidase [Roseisalinus antarcticus]|uniref:Alpha-galactosidase n=1 Tax=Roseisalinus antarcticus TaxID=254357 RepID=A0A1Y5RX56_9RHOB|nr:alpha-galactosidase [Roseisalinus antarcticus]SLN24586.1 Alpha-galactosidase [Roseisalinus antarcticus]
MTQTWRLDAGRQTLAFASDGGMPRCIWWGPRLPEAEDLDQLAVAGRMDMSGGWLDVLPPLTLCPLLSDGWQGQPGLTVTRAGAEIPARFGGCRGAVEGDSLRLTVRDAAHGLTLMVLFRAEPTGLIAASTRLEADEPVEVAWLAAPVLPGPSLADEIIDVSGRWTGEFALNTLPWTPGIRAREARTGRSGHEHPPFALFPDRGATNAAGTVRGMHYGWSGGHRMVAEELPDGRRQIQWGHATRSLAAGTSFETADLLLSFSNTGLNGCGMVMQWHIRDHIVQWPQPDRPRPVHYNCWEAIYFDHDLAALSDIAEHAADLGAERFVLDDGWFGRRDDDTTSLGDWDIDRRKWPDGLTPLIDKVHSLGMTFGLWFEPEMVNPDSDLYRDHPDWALGPADQIMGRHQMVLDLSLPQVRDYLFDKIAAVLWGHDIDYIKWDHNRLLPVVEAAQTDGAYALFNRLREAFPQVEIESCASGGGRIDTGILARTHRVWLSDSNDALERLRMQHDAALFLPSAITGSHVGPRHCHTSGRILSMSFRARVAAQRHMGFEMDPRELTEDETATLKAVTAWYKANRDWMMAGDILRLDTADPSVTAELQRSADGARFVVFAGQAEAPEQAIPRPLRLAGLEPEALYEISLLNPEDAARQSRGPVALRDGPLRLSGRALMDGGLNLPVAWPGTMWMVEGKRL